MKNDFEDFESTSAGRRARTLLLDHTVKPEQIFDAVLAEIAQVLPHLDDNVRYTTERLCGPDLWAAWHIAEGRVAGMCLAYMVRRKMVELFRHRTRSGAGKAFYRTTPSPEPVGGQPIRIVRLHRHGYVQRMAGV